MSLCGSFLTKLKKKVTNIRLLNCILFIRASNRLYNKALAEYSQNKTQVNKAELIRKLNVLADIRNDYKKKYTKLKQVKLKLKEELNELAKKD